MTTAVTKPAPAMASARGVAIVLVVLYHADVDLTGFLPGYHPFLAVVDALRYITVPLFLLCFGLALSGKADSARRLTTEAVNYAYVYVVWFGISLVLSALIVRANVGVPQTLHALIKTLILPDSPLWFPYGLALMLLSAAVLSRQSVGLRLALAFGVGFVPYLTTAGSRVAVFAISTNTVFFYVGLLCRTKIFRVFKANTRALCLGAGALYGSLLLLSIKIGWPGFPLIYLVLGLLGFVSIVSFWMLQPSTLLSRVLAKLGRAALPILVLHDFWIHVAELLPLGRIFPLFGPAEEFFIPCLIGAFGLFASYVTFRLIGRVQGFFVAPAIISDGTVAAIRAVRRIVPAPKKAVPTPTD